jgi:PAT family beta-lactamase induction signal transducer AmpG
MVATMANIDDNSAYSAPQRPWLFALLIAPMAVLSNGIMAGVLAYLMGRQGINPARQSTVIALLTLPQTIYFLWSPLTDFWFARRRWLLLGAIGAAFAVAIALRSVRLDAAGTIALLFTGGCLGQLVVASCGGLMGMLRGELVRRRASGFYQAGSLGFGALALFALTLLAQRLSLPELGVCMAALIALPGLASLWAPDHGLEKSGGLLPTLRLVGSEFRATFLRWSAVPYLACMLLPMGSGALSGLLPGLAAEYHISGAQIAWINGLGGSLLCCVGSLAAGLAVTRLRSVYYYALICSMNLIPLAVLWLGPLTPVTYLVGSLLMLLSIGACYGAFTGVVLEFLGHSGKSGSARYSLINSLGNVPVAYMAYVDGRGYARWGAHGMPGVDLCLSVAGLAVLLMLAWRQPAPVDPTSNAAISASTG